MWATNANKAFFINNLREGFAIESLSVLAVVKQLQVADR
jgi:hypothetical protein